MTQEQKLLDRSLYNYDSEKVQIRIRQVMKELGVKEYVGTKKAAAGTATR